MKFSLKIDGTIWASFSEVTIPDISTVSIEHREGKDPILIVPPMPGMKKFGNVILKRGTTDSTELSKWFKSTISGPVKRKEISIILLDEQGKESGRWNFHGAFPTKYEATELKPQGNEIAIETVEFAHGGMEKV